MSRHNRIRRGWKCSGCKAGLWKQLKESAEAEAKKRSVQDKLVHVCGNCKTCHYEEGDRLRPLTANELFQLHMEVPGMMQEIENLRCPNSTTPSGTLLIGDH